MKQYTDVKEARRFYLFSVKRTASSLSRLAEIVLFSPFDAQFLVDIQDVLNVCYANSVVSDVIIWLCSNHM